MQGPMNAPDSNDTDPGNAALMPTQYVKASTTSLNETAKRVVAEHVKHHGTGGVDDPNYTKGTGGDHGDQWPAGNWPDQHSY